ncbi:MAG: two-component regulator propeller domain-containing protein [Blastocatellales bacterium]
MKKITSEQMRRLLIRVGFCSVILFSLANQAFAQYQFDSWTTEDGLPQNSINDILQTRDGYLWLATNGGLVRFDGTRFVIFDRSTEGIGTQRVRALLEDSKGTLWIGAEDGKLIQYRDGKFKTYTVEDGLPFSQTARIEEDEEGNLWITWHGAIIAVTKFDGKRFVNYFPRDFSFGVNGDSGKRNPWWSQDSIGLHCLIRGRVQTYTFQSGLPKSQIIGVQIDRKSNLWIHTKGAGLIRPANGQLKRYTVREGLPSNEVEGYLLEDSKGNIWISNPLKEDRILYHTNNGKYDLISNFPAGILYEDQEGAIWIGATSSGLHRVRNIAITLLTKQDGLSNKWVYPIFRDRSGAIWIGSVGVNKFDNGRMTHYGSSDGLLSDNITCIYQDNSGKLWIGAYGGISYLKDGRFNVFLDEYGFLKSNVWAMHQDRKGIIWFGTDDGLVRLKDNHFTRFTTNEGLSNDRVITLFEDRAESLWIGTYHGLTKLKDGVFTTYTERDGFIGSWVRAIYQDGDGVFWIGTYDGGLYRLKDKKLTRYTKNEGLYDNGVFQILEDDAGNLWMGCNRGIYRVSRRELNNFAEGKARSITSTVFGVKDGLASVECNGGRQPSGLKTADGRLWFPTAGGVAIVDPKAVQFNSVPPPVIIEEFHLDDKPVDFLNGVEVSPDIHSFEIRYTAPSFIKTELVRFKYKLVGLDEDWIDAGDRRIAHYHRIPPGQYQFVVIAANNDGVWNTEGKSLEIVVIPPFWMRWWFVAIVTLAITTIIFWRYKNRLRHLRREHARQQAFSRQLLESQESERKRIAYELHDSLEQYMLVARNNALLGADMAATGSAIKERFDDVTSMASQALEEVRRISHNLRPSQLDELGLKDALEAMIESVANSSEIVFSAEIDPIDDGALSKEAEMNLYRIAQECISNILKHSDATEAEVKLRRDGRKVRLVIKDNGKGFISDSTKPAEVHRRGFGLTGISERARMMGGKETVYSVPGKGTTITVTITLQDERHEP